MDLKKTMLKSVRGNVAIYSCSSRVNAHGTLLCLHGGPNGDHHGNENVFDEILSYSIDMGFNFVTFDMYGSGNSDGNQIDFDLSSMQDDYKTVLAFCEDNFEDPIHIIGESMGATVAVMNWYLKAKSNILLWPAFDLADTDLEPYLSGSWQKMAKEKGSVKDGDLEMGASFLAEINNYDFNKCFSLPDIPTLMVHGRMDNAVPFNQSIRASTESHGPITLYIHPKGDHGLQKKDEREYTHGAIRKWLSDF